MQIVLLDHDGKPATVRLDGNCVTSCSYRNIMTDAEILDDLSTSILALYPGPLEAFVTRRDALVKQLRATRQREAADRVKALRKPSRMAWVLDSVVHEDPAAIEQLDAALQQAQTGADLRTALERVKAAVRDVAAIGARVAVRAEQPVEPSAVVAALYAVIGDAGALELLRAGQLVDVPDAGGLDMLAATVREQPHAARSSSPAAVAMGAVETERPTDPAQRDAEGDAARVAAQRAEAARQRAELVEAARTELREAEMALAEMSVRSRQAVQVALNAQREVDAAERAVLHAQSEARARREDLERVEAEVAAAAVALKDATEASTAARERVEQFDTSLPD